MIVLYISLALLAMILCVGGYLFFTACRRVKGHPWLDREALAKTDFAQHCDAVENAWKWLQDNHAQNVTISSEDGLKLNGYYVPAEDPVGSILLVHGYHSTHLVDFGRALPFYHRQGLNILLPDQRCHWNSEGKYTTFGVKESRDMLAWLAYLNRELFQGPVLLSGMSMGASTVMYMVPDLPENVKGMIVDCGFTSPADIIGKVFRDVAHIPAVPWIWGAEVFARCLGKFSLWEKDSRETLSHNILPILMVHGAADDFVPCEMSRQGYARCGGDKELLLVEGAGHGVSFLVAKEKYGKKLRELMKKALGETYELRDD